MSKAKHDNKDKKKNGAPVGLAKKHLRMSLDHPTLKTCVGVIKKCQAQTARIGTLAKIDTPDIKFDAAPLRASLDQQIKLARETIVSVTGYRPVEITLPVSYSMAVNTSGVLAAVFPMDPTAASEFSSLAALFDEYKLISASFKFNFACNNTATGTAATNDNVMAVIAFDPAEGTPLTSVRNGTELWNHKLFGSPASNGTLATQFSRSNGEPHSMEYKPPHGVLAAINSNVQYAAAGEWVPTISTQNVLYWGYKKTYYQTSYTGTTQNALCGICYYRLAFRSRS